MLIMGWLTYVPGDASSRGGLSGLCEWVRVRSYEPLPRQLARTLVGRVNGQRGGWLCCSGWPLPYFLPHLARLIRSVAGPSATGNDGQFRCCYYNGMNAGASNVISEEKIWCGFDWWVHGGDVDRNRVMRGEDAGVGVERGVCWD
jgi:hypothetical protein